MRPYIFDIDGTLTPSRRRMDKGFEAFFDIWADSNEFYFITGSDLVKVLEQVPESIVQKASGIFCCCGNEYLVPRDGDYEVVYSHKFKPPEDLLDYLNSILKSSEYHHRAGKHLEDRGSLLNFSVVGRNCSVMERENYFEWDNKNNERLSIVDYIKEEWPELDASKGGQISVDIHIKGKDKSQMLDSIGWESITFIGDRTMPGGNDYPLAQAIEKANAGKVYQVDGWKETKSILEKL